MDLEGVESEIRLNPRKKSTSKWDLVYKHGQLGIGDGGRQGGGKRSASSGILDERNQQLCVDLNY